MLLRIFPEERFRVYLIQDKCWLFNQHYFLGLTNCFTVTFNLLSKVLTIFSYTWAAAQQLGEKIVEMTQQVAEYRKALLAVKARSETMQEAFDLAAAARQDIAKLIDATEVLK